MINNIRHFGITCKDAVKSIHFYNVLGFSLINAGTLTELETENLLGIKDILIYYKLGLKDNPYPCIELYRFNTYKSNFPCLHHIAFTVKNIEEVYEKLYELGISFISKPTLDNNSKNKLCFCKDWEGNLIELVEEIK